MVDDEEIVAFWKGVRDNGHPDKASGWIELTDIASLTDILTTIAFNGSVHHTAVNFGEYILFTAAMRRARFAIVFCLLASA